MENLDLSELNCLVLRDLKKKSLIKYSKKKLEVLDIRKLEFYYEQLYGEEELNENQKLQIKAINKSQKKSA